MKAEDTKLICIQDGNAWCVYPEKMSGIIVQVDDIKDAPKELARSFEAIFRHGFDTNIHEIYNVSDIRKKLKKEGKTRTFPEFKKEIGL